MFVFAYTFQFNRLYHMFLFVNDFDILIQTRVDNAIHDGRMFCFTACPHLAVTQRLSNNALL